MQLKSPAVVEVIVHTVPPLHVTVTDELAAKLVPFSDATVPTWPDAGLTLRVGFTENAAIAV